MLPNHANIYKNKTNKNRNILYYRAFLILFQIQKTTILLYLSMGLIEKRKQIVSKLKGVIDPEIGMNIVDVGLIYNIEVDESNLVTVTMTLTTPGCPLTDYFLSEIETSLMDLEFIEDVQIVFSWTPAWDLIMMDEGAKQNMFESMR